MEINITHNMTQKVRDAVEAIRARYPQPVQVGMVLGSGLGPIADLLENPVTIPYREIPHFHGVSVQGHSGEMTLGTYQGVGAVVLKGRYHLYEGYPMSDVVFPTRVVCSLGVQSFLLTAAAGGVNTRFRAGDIMVLADHLNLMGDNPLKGPNLAEMGPRFPDMTEAYSPRIIELFETASRELGIPVHKGVYAGMLGPTYETPAEVRMLRTLGADACGMSTVPESIAANHMGVEVGGLVLITNLAAGMTSNKLTHDEVMETSKTTVARLRAMMEYSIPRLHKNRKS